MSLKKHLVIALSAILLLASGAVASAQTTGQSAASSSTTTPGAPNTGAGGSATANWAILAVTGIVVIAGVAYLLRRPEISDAQ